jgi:two-component system, cell cycle response regulator DivK
MTSRAMSSESSPLVLVVDDMVDGREICAEYLSFRGYRVATAADGLEALAKAFDLLPHVILMDLSLPGIDGWEATRRLKRDERTRRIPVIALTAHALPSARDEALAAGCDSVVTKPCLPKELEAEVRRQIERQASDRDGKTP